MSAECGDGHCREIMCNGIYRMPDFQLEIGKQNIEGSIERDVGGVEPGTARVIRARRHVAVIVITGLNMGDRGLIQRHGLATGPEG